MAIGALLGIKTVGRDAEHVIALNTDAMDHTRAVPRGLIFRGVRRRGGMFAHGGILAQENDAGGSEGPFAFSPVVATNRKLQTDPLSPGSRARLA